MATTHSRPPRPVRGALNQEKLNEIVTRARDEHDQRLQGYREQALRLYPWVCTRCGRGFTPETVHDLTVHHRDHNHDNNPPDGSNWELLCRYCHDNEHARYTDAVLGEGMTLGSEPEGSATFKPFADLKAKLKREPRNG